MEYTIEEIKAIVREALKWDDVEMAICNSDYEDGKEYEFDSTTAIAKLKVFAESE